jgi:hypothetical protein
MQRSSDTIGAIAAALAKAQAELINPVKSLIGIIGNSSPPELRRAFRYAPLSSGLDIIRKSLGRHAIAIVQSTAIDKEAGLVRLNTVLAHSSGEWVASEWPVCPIGDTASPQRMGAALTYARRYALFTLVGIAGEDDLDAPDLGVARKQEPGNPIEPNGQFHPREHIAADHSNGSRNRKRLPRNPKTLLDPEASSILRDQLMIELATITTADDAVAWAHRSLPAKNTLTAADASVIEEAFQAKMQAAQRTENENTSSNAHGDDRGNNLDAQPILNEAKSDSGVRTENIVDLDDPKSATIDDHHTAVALIKPVRKRDKAHRDFVCSQPCLVCGRRPSDAHHIRFGQPRALGRKVSDEFTVPLCRVHHRDLHRRSDEKKWWEVVKIEPMEIAQKLWRETRD